MKDRSPHHLLRCMAAAAVLASLSAMAPAQQPMAISLTGSAQAPPVTTSAVGSAQIAVSADRSVSGTVETSGVDSTSAHIHEGAVGENGPPIVTLNKTSENGFSVPLGSRLSDAQYASYVAGMLYVNVHSSRYPEGELRGQLLRTENAAAPRRAGH